MSLATLRPRTQVLLAALVPVICLAIGAGLLLPHLSRLRRYNDELEEIQAQIAEKKRHISQAEAESQGRSLALAVAMADEKEPIVFLRQLADLIAESGAALVSVRATTPAPLTTAEKPAATPRAELQPAASPAAGQGQRPVIPSTVRELADEVTVEGRFSDLLALIVRLENFERILSVSQCRLSSSGARSYPRLKATFTLSRFVAAPEAAPAPASLGASAGSGQQRGTR